MSTQQDNTNQPLEALLWRSEENLQRTMRDALGQMQEKMEHDMASLKEQHKVELMTLHDQMARRDDNHTQGDLQYSGHIVESQRVSSRDSTHREKLISRTPTRRSS